MKLKNQVVFEYSEVKQQAASLQPSNKCFVQ